jgi:hypothetical protein
MSAAKKPRVHPVPLPADWDAERASEHARRGGYSSIRVSKVTLALLKRVQEQASNDAARRHEYGRYYRTGLDELLYFDALQRLGELPPRKGGR